MIINNSINQNYEKFKNINYFEFIEKQIIISNFFYFLYSLCLFSYLFWSTSKINFVSNDFYLFIELFLFADPSLLILTNINFSF